MRDDAIKCYVRICVSVFLFVQKQRDQAHNTKQQTINKKRKRDRKNPWTQKPQTFIPSQLTHTHLSETK